MKRNSSTPHIHRPQNDTNHRRVRAFTAVSLSAVMLLMFIAGTKADASPLTANSTQPSQLVDKLESPAVCSRCHVDPLRDWSGSMMGNDFRDPSFLAMLSISEKDVPGVGDYCLRCHAAGWFEGKSEPPGGDFLGKSFAPPPSIDQESVPLCDLCHRMQSVGMRRSRFDGRQMAEGNGSVYIRNDDPWKGGKHPLTPLHKKGELCGSCHDVSSPVSQSRNDPDQPHPLERTYTEWKFSQFAENGMTCQNCHPPMKFPGAQTWLLYPGMASIFKNVDAGWVAAGYTSLPADRSYAWESARERDERLMTTAADLDVATPAGFQPGRDMLLKVKVTNNTGHKLPTGFAEGRQMWVHVRAKDASGKVIFEDGRLDAAGGLVRTAATKVYEQQAGEGDLKSYNFAKLDTIIKDNRIPPLGFNKKAYEAEGAYIIGADYRDGQNWDTTDYKISVPADAQGPLDIQVRLKYETYSKEFIDWLLAEDDTPGANHGGPAAATPDGSRTWAETTAKLWRLYGRGKPVLIASQTVAVPDETGSAVPGYLPVIAAVALAVVAAGLWVWRRGA